MKMVAINQHLTSIYKLPDKPAVYLKILMLCGLLVIPTTLIAADISVLFSKGSNMIRHHQNTKPPQVLVSGMNLKDGSNSSIQISPGGILFLESDGKCLRLDKPGLHLLNSIASDKEAFACRVELFFNRITTPRTLLNEPLPRGSVTQRASDKDVFNKIWQSVVLSVNSRQYFTTGELIGAVAYFHQHENWPRFNYLLGLIAQRLPVFKKMYLESWQKTSPKAVSAEVKATRQAVSKQLPKLKNIALLIGIEKYKYPYWQALVNPVTDVEAIGRLLIEQYGFQKKDVRILRNATQHEILDAFDVMARATDNNTNLLVYYAGHGYLPLNESDGFWIPSDAGSPDSKNHFISNHEVLERMHQMPSRHTLLMADSCFSGDLVRKIRGDRIYPSRYYVTLSRKSSRQVIAAGGLESVEDRSGNSSHSIFARELLTILKDPRKTPLSATELALHIRKAVINSGSGQTPVYGRLTGDRHEVGEFFFVRKDLNHSDFGDQVLLPENQQIKPLVAVFNLQSDILTPEQTSSLSSVFRSSLKESGLVNISSHSGAELDLNTAIEAGRCKPELCALELGRQFGVDEVISMSIHRFKQNVFFISSEIISTTDGSILSEKTLKHTDGAHLLDQTIRQLAFDLVEANGRLKISSHPEDAEFIIDRTMQSFKTNTDWIGVSPGMHVVTVFKDDLWAAQPVFIKSGESKEVHLILKPERVTKKVNTSPIGASVFINDRFKGKAPLVLDLKPGTYQLKTRLEGFQEDSRELTIGFLPSDELNIKLQKEHSIQISVSPPGTSIEINGHVIATDETPVTIDTVNDYKTVTIGLTEGSHRIRLKLRGNLNAWEEKVIEVKRAAELTFHLPISQGYIDTLRYEKSYKTYETRELISRLSLVVGVLGTFHSLDAYLKATSAAASKREAEDGMTNAASQQQATEHYQTAAGHGNDIKLYNQNFQNGILLALIGYGVAYWTKTDPPEKPGQISLKPVISESGAVSIGYEIRW